MWSCHVILPCDPAMILPCDPAMILPCDVQQAPDEILTLICCGCESDLLCVTGRCKCATAQLPCIPYRNLLLDYFELTRIYFQTTSFYRKTPCGPFFREVILLPNQTTKQVPRQGTKGWIMDGRKRDDTQCSGAAQRAQPTTIDDIIEGCHGGNITHACKVIIFNLCVRTVQGLSQDWEFTSPKNNNISWECTIFTSFAVKKIYFLLNY